MKIPIAIDLGEMPHPMPASSSLGERIWASVTELTAVAVVLATVTAGLLAVAAALISR